MLVLDYWFGWLDCFISSCLFFVYLLLFMWVLVVDFGFVVVFIVFGGHLILGSCAYCFACVCLFCWLPMFGGVIYFIFGLVWVFNCSFDLGFRLCSFRLVEMFVSEQL